MRTPGTLLASALLALVAGRALGVSGPAFEHAASYGDATARALEAADFNRDGRPDLACAYNNSGIQILLNDGAGGFRPGAYMPSETEYLALASGDFDGDGSTDLAVSEYPAPGIHILLGRGDGTFADFGFVGHPDAISLAAADFNRDGLTDLAAAHQSYAVTLLLAKPKRRGRFYPPRLVDDTNRLSTLIARDLDRDGSPDLVVAWVEPSIEGTSIHWGDGRGGWSGATELPHFDGRVNGVGDANGDGQLDLILAAKLNPPSWNWGTAVALAAGSRAYLPPALVAPYSVVAAADMSGDGVADVIAKGPESLGVGVGDGLGSFAAPRFFAAGEYFSLEIDDFDGDGRLDLACGCTDQLVVLLSDGMGGYRTGRTTPLADQTAHGAAVSEPRDFDGDGNLDVVVVSLGWQLMRGDGQGRFHEQSLPIGLAPALLTAADFDGDGSQDLIYSTRAIASVRVDFGDGAGGFPAEAESPLGVAGTVYGLAVGDIDRDGSPDIVVSTVFGAQIRTIFNDGNGGLLPPVEASGALLECLSLLDFDGDGALDLVGLASGRRSVEVFRGDAAGGWIQTERWPIGRQASSLAPLGDLDGDGRPELALLLPEPGELHILEVGAAGSLADRLTQALPVAVPGGLTRTLLPDGRTLLAVAGTSPTLVQLLVSMAGGALEPAGQLRSGVTGGVPQFGDFDGNGRVDLVLAPGLRPHVTTFLDASTADISLALSDGTDALAPSGTVDYTLTVSNAGPDDAVGIPVLTRLAASLQGISWTCTAAPGGSCGPGGAGDVVDRADLPAGATATYTISATVSAGARCVVSEARATPSSRGVDPAPDNQHAFDADAIVDGLGFKLTDVTVSERSPFAKLVVKLAAAPCVDIRLPWTAEGGTATGGQDYLDTEGALVVRKGEKRSPLNVALLQDDAIEPMEDFLVRLWSPLGQVVGRVFIKDDDGR